MTVEEIPQDVLWVMTLPKYVGGETYYKAQMIIGNYPEWFAQEHIYNSIPEEVKVEFETEKFVLYESFFPRVQIEHIPGEGIIGYCDRVNEINRSLPQKSVEESLNYIFVEKPKKEKAYRKDLVKLHNKHFKKYGYLFQG